MSRYYSVTDPIFSLDRVALHKTWAPDDSVWSPWVKPVPFAFWPRQLKASPSVLRTEVTPALFPPASTGFALLVDLPGGESVRCGLLLASLGYRPVPIFSSCPLSAAKQGLYLCSVDADDVITALVESAPALSALSLPASAPPAFLIDAHRQGSTHILSGDYFDNRSALFTSDFPSAETLRKHGISRVRIIRDGTIPATPDLGHALKQWREGKLHLEVLTHTGTPAEITWPARGMLGKIYYRVKLFLSLRPNEQGGYGRFVPESSGG